jgi:FtsP/CotA-like multicopper oxidase with cupredoxin domain
MTTVTMAIILSKSVALFLAFAGQAYSLSQTATNGDSLLGTLSNPPLSDFLTNDPLPDGFPWGSCTVFNTNSNDYFPDTGLSSLNSLRDRVVKKLTRFAPGVTRKYDWTVTNQTLAPDGFSKEMLLVNGAFPGVCEIDGRSITKPWLTCNQPLIEANWGDMIEVTVRNELAEATSVHWHGFRQFGSQWEDGVPSFSQCPIVPGSTFTYRIKAELYGTSWWHSHTSDQFSAGFLGPIVIHGPKSEDYDIDLGPILLSDWYHGDYQEIVEYILQPRPRPPAFPADNNLINGKNNFDCSLGRDSVGVSEPIQCVENAGLAKFNFTANKRHLLRLVNTGTASVQQFSIDEHTMTVIANDYVPVQPYNTTVVTLGVGQRTDVIVEGKCDAGGAYWMRSNITCSEAIEPQVRAIIYYNEASTDATPNSTAQVYDAGCANDPLSQTVPAFPMPAEDAQTTETITITPAQNETGTWLWYMNNSSFFGDVGNPVLLLANKGLTDFQKPSWNVYNMGTNSTYRFISASYLALSYLLQLEKLIVAAVRNRSPLYHPMHFHGHSFSVLVR